MKCYLKPGLIGLAILFAVLIGMIIGDQRSPIEQWRDFFRSSAASTSSTLNPNDPALQARLPRADLEVIYPHCPLNALLKPGLTPQEQTSIIGQMLIDYWTTTRSLPNGTWEEICSQLAGNNREKLALVPAGHPALGEDSFTPGEGQPGVRLHVIGSSSCFFQLIFNGPDGEPYTTDDQIRDFPQDGVNR